MVADVTTKDPVAPSIPPLPNPMIPHPVQPTKPPQVPPQNDPAIPVADPGGRDSVEHPVETGQALPPAPLDPEASQNDPHLGADSATPDSDTNLGSQTEEVAGNLQTGDVLKPAVNPNSQPPANLDNPQLTAGSGSMDHPVGGDMSSNPNSGSNDPQSGVNSGHSDSSQSGTGSGYTQSETNAEGTYAGANPGSNTQPDNSQPGASPGNSKSGSDTGAFNYNTPNPGAGSGASKPNDQIFRAGGQSDQGTSNAAQGNPALGGTPSPPTTIQLGPPQDQRPTTINIRPKPSNEYSAPNFGTNSNNVANPGMEGSAPGANNDNGANTGDLGGSTNNGADSGIGESAPSPGDTVDGGPTIIVSSGNTNSNPNANNPAGGIAKPDPVVVTAAGQLLTISDPSAIPIAGTVLTPGGAAVTIAGTPVSLRSDAHLVVGTAPPASISAIITIAGNTVQANPTSFNIGDIPLKAGFPGVTISGTPVSLGPTGDLVIGGHPDTVSAQQPGPVFFTVGDQMFAAHPTGFDIGSTKVAVNGPAVSVADTPIRLASSGVLVIGSSTTHLDPTPEPFTSLIVGDQTLRVNAGGFEVAGTTVTPGGSAFILAGRPISLGQSGVLVVGSSTTTLATSPTQPSIFTAGDQIFTANPTAFEVAGQILSAGAQGTTIDGTLVSLNPSGSLVIGTNTFAIAKSTEDHAKSSIFTVGDQTFTANPTAFAIDGHTLSAGGPGTTVDGTLVSLNPFGSLVIGTSTVPLSPTPSIFTTDGHIFTAFDNGVVAVDGVTLSNSGSGTTIGGVPMKVQSGRLVVGSDTISLPTASGSVDAMATTTASASDSMSAFFTPSPTGNPAKPTSSHKGASSRLLTEWSLGWYLGFLVIVTMSVYR